MSLVVDGFLSSLPASLLKLGDSNMSLVVDGFLSSSLT